MGGQRGVKGGWILVDRTRRYTPILKRRTGKMGVREKMLPLRTC